MNGTMQKTNQNHSKTSKKFKKTWITSKKGMAFSWLLLMLQLLQNQQENLRKPSKTTPKSTKNLRKPAAAAVLLLLLAAAVKKRTPPRCQTTMAVKDDNAGKQHGFGALTSHLECCCCCEAVGTSFLTGSPCFTRGRRIYIMFAHVHASGTDPISLWFRLFVL